MIAYYKCILFIYVLNTYAARVCEEECNLKIIAHAPIHLYLSIKNVISAEARLVQNQKRH